MTCKTCIYAKVHNKELLRCHRYPPQVNITLPVTSIDNFCGEYLACNDTKLNFDNIDHLIDFANDAKTYLEQRFLDADFYRWRHEENSIALIKSEVVK